MSKAFKCDICKEFQEGEHMVFHFSIIEEVKMRHGMDAPMRPHFDLCKYCLAQVEGQIKAWREQQLVRPA